jgi:hypothetical protein
MLNVRDGCAKRDVRQWAFHLTLDPRGLWSLAIILEHLLKINGSKRRAFAFLIGQRRDMIRSAVLLHSDFAWHHTYRLP